MASNLQMSKVRCRNCDVVRWNDGLKCPHCDVYQNPKAGTSMKDQTPVGMTSSQVLGRNAN